MKVKVTARPRGETPPTPVTIHTEFIKLDAFLKFAAVTQTGGEAKLMINDGLVKVNGESCTQRCKKIRPGDHIWVDGQSFVVKGGDDVH